MCGIIGAISQRDISKVLLEGLRRLEYRGYDSAGIAIINDQGLLQRIRNKVSRFAYVTPSPSGRGGKHGSRERNS